MQSSRVSERDQLQVPIEAHLKRDLKVAAVKRGQSLWQVVEQAAREWLQREGGRK